MKVSILLLIGLCMISMTARALDEPTALIENLILASE